MDLVKLNSNHHISKMVENYDSLIWTERYGSCGDFKLVTSNVEYFMDLLPAETVVSLRDSYTPMIVETHLIERKKNQPQKLTISGRSFESILDRRVLNTDMDGTTNFKDLTINTADPVKTAWGAMSYVLLGELDPNDVFPASKVRYVAPADYLDLTGPSKPFELTRGNLLSIIEEILKIEYAADPTTTPPTVAQPPRSLGAFRPASDNPTDTAVALTIYKGQDRRNSVIFDATRDQLDDGVYLFSTVGSANVAYGVGDRVVAKMNEGASVPTGLDRRVILVDASTTDIKNVDSLRSYMSMSLSEARPTAMFDGSINIDRTNYKYGTDYWLGDLVTLRGDYGLDETARVVEYIRSEDATGEKAYPTLTTVTNPV